MEWRRWEKGVQRRWRYLLEQAACLRYLGIALVTTSLLLFVYEGWLKQGPTEFGQTPLRSERDGLLRGFPPEPKPLILSMDVNSDTGSEWWPVLPNASPEHQFVICSKIGNEVPYLLEWIEFHRAQGVDRFALYTDDGTVSPKSQNSAQQIALIVSAYQDIGVTDLIDLYSVSSFLGEVQYDVLDPNTCNDTTTEMHRLSQQSLLKHCKETYQHLTEWLVHIDVDEFLHAPLHDTLSGFFDSLYELTPETSLSESFAANYLVGNLSGVYVWPVSYGLSSGRLLDQRVAVRSSIATGTAEIAFDPRASQTTLTELLQRLHEETMGKKVPPKAVDLFGKLVKESLNPLIDKAEFDSPEKVLSSTSQLQEVWRKAKQLAETLSEDEEARDLLAREVEAAFAEMRASSFPLVIDEQRRRMPSLDYGDDFSKVASAIVEMHPECKEYIDILLLPENEDLRSKIGAEARIKKYGEAPFPYCVPGDLPYGLTNLGKSLLWTGHRFRPPANFRVPQAYTQKGELHRLDAMNKFPLRDPRQRRNPRLVSELEQRTQCLQPWVHICSHKTWAPYVSAVVATQLRLDHHMLRSLESRTIADAKWRSSGWGKFMIEKDVLDFSVLEFTSLIEDNSKAKYIPKIRKAIAKLNTKLVPAQVALPTGAQNLRTTWFAGECDLGKLLLRQQHMCPATFPNVGFFAHNVTPPQALVPLSWCTNQTHLTNAVQLKRYAPIEEFDPDCSGSDRCQQLKREVAESFELKDIAMCPGMPHTDCCDYSAKHSLYIETFMKAYGAFQAYNQTVSRPLELEHWWRPVLYAYLGQD